MNKYDKLYAELVNKASAITTGADAADRDLSADEMAQIDALLADADQAKLKGDQLRAIAAHKATLDAPLPAKADPVSTHIPGTTKPAIEDDPKRGFANMGEFALSVAAAGNPNISGLDNRLLIGAAVTGLNQGVGAEGGFDVPPEFSTVIWDGLNEQPDNLLAMTDQFVLSHTESLTLNANAETSRANGSRYGGVSGSWISEADQIANSKPTLRQIKLEPEEYAVLVYATDKLLRNGNAMESYLTRAAIDEINFASSDAIMNGTGTGQPLGIIGHASVVEVAKETAQVADTVVYANIRKMWSRMHARPRRTASWFINQDVEPELMGMEDGNGNVIYLPGGNLASGPFATLLGKPVIPLEYSQTLGDAGDIMLGNFDYYATALRSDGIRSAVSIHLRFDFAETAFRFMFELDGRPWLSAPLTPKNGTNTTSPFVTLAERA